jgi:MSHA biogenesis protein MshQ
LQAGRQASASIQAVRADDITQLCVPAFESGTRTLLFTSAYANPNSGTLVPEVNGQPVNVATPVAVSFGAQARASLQIRYDDAGQMSLEALYAPTSGPESGLVMSGSATYVSRPYGICLETAAEQSSDYSADSSLFPGGVRAGDSFDLTIKPVIWTAASDAAPPLQAGAICSNPTTPNYQQAGIALTLDELNGGHAGVLGVASHAHSLGGATVIDQSVSEVGVFRLTATPPAYLGTDMSHAVSQSGRVGRFIPAYFKVEGAASVRPACGNAFSYQGQPMPFVSGLEPSLTVTAYSRLHNVTRNYDRPGSWKLADPAVGPYVSVTAELLDPADPEYASKLVAAGERDPRLASQGAPVLAVTGADDGDGARKYTWSGQELLYAQPLVPGLADYPFRARIRQEFSAASLTDPEEVCHGDGNSCQPYGYVFADSPGSEVRLGRLRIGNAHGSELQGLSLPLLLESWQGAAGGSFQVETMDTCTALGTASLGGFTGNLAAGETTPTTSEPLAGVGSLRLTAPGAGNDGSVRAGFPALPLWLQYPWDGVVRQGASGLATFGIYRGPAPLIFRRELYR